MASAFFHLCLITFLARVSYQMARSPVLPRFAQDLGAAPALIGLIVGASTLTGVVLKFPAGVFSDRVGRHRMLVVGAAFFAFPSFLYPFVQTPQHLLALRFVHGLATAIFMPVAGAAVVDLFRASKGERLGWFSLIGEFGAALGPVVGGWLLFRTQSYPETYLVSAGLGLTAFLLMLRWHAQELSRAAPIVEPLSAVWRRIREILRRRVVLLTSAMEGCLFLGIGAFIGFIPLLAKQHGVHEAQVGLILGMMLLTSMLGKPLTGRISDRIGRKPMIQAGLALCVAVLPWTGVATSFWGLLVISAMLGLARALVTPSTAALVAEQAHDVGYGSALGIHGTVYDIGDAGGPILAGVLIAGLGYLACFSIIAAVIAAGLCAFSLLVPETKTVGG